MPITLFFLEETPIRSVPVENSSIYLDFETCFYYKVCCRIPDFIFSKNFFAWALVVLLQLVNVHPERLELVREDIAVQFGLVLFVEKRDLFSL